MANFHADPVNEWSMAFTILICVFAVIGNAMVIYVIVSLREYKKSVTHLYILQLCIADFFHAVYLPFRAVADWRGSWIFGDGFCVFGQTMKFLNYYASILFLVIMSCDRYTAVCHPLNSKLNRYRELKHAKIISTIAWLVSLLLCVPIMMYSTVDSTCHCHLKFISKEANAEYLRRKHAECVASVGIIEFCDSMYIKDGNTCDSEQTSTGGDIFAGFGLIAGVGPDNNNGTDEFDLSALLGGSFGNFTQTGDMGAGAEAEYCKSFYPNDPASVNWMKFIHANFVITFLVPMIVLTFTYGRIAYQIKKSMIKPNASNDAPSKSSKDRAKITLTCGLLVLCFLFCWLPFYTIHLAKLDGISVSAHTCNLLSQIGFLFGALNSALNPYVYAILGTSFWKRLKKACSETAIIETGSNSGSVRYRRKKEGKSSSDVTILTRLFRRSRRKYKDGRKEVTADESSLPTTTQNNNGAAATSGYLAASGSSR